MRRLYDLVGGFALVVGLLAFVVVAMALEALRRDARRQWA